MTVLLFINWFDPAYKAGGPITSAVNFVNSFSAFANIKVVTTAFDMDGSIVVDKSRISKWIRYTDKAEVYYANTGEISYGFIRSLYKTIRPDIIYCNSMFSFPFTILPVLVNKVSKYNGQVVLAPRGMLKRSALAYKPFKKWTFLNFSKLFGLFNNIRFQATDAAEKQDVFKIFPKASVMVVGNYPSKLVAEVHCIEKIAGRLRIMFLGRIHEIKQLHYLLECLNNVKDAIELVIIGPLESAVYWEKCSNLIKNLPDNIVVQYLGEKSPAEIEEIYSHIHILALPTQGENFGHSIYEAMAHGKPVIISDRTPWINLSATKSGFSLNLSDQRLFVNAIEAFAQMSQEEYNHWCEGAYFKAKSYLVESELSENYQKLFNIL